MDTHRLSLLSRSSSFSRVPHDTLFTHQTQKYVKVLHNVQCPINNMVNEGVLFHILSRLSLWSMLFFQWLTSQCWDSSGLQIIAKIQPHELMLFMETAHQPKAYCTLIPMVYPIRNDLVAICGHTRGFWRQSIKSFLMWSRESHNNPPAFLWSQAARLHPLFLFGPKNWPWCV